jgi:hypothetical protein
MKVQFRVLHLAAFGQSRSVYGNCPKLGTRWQSECVSKRNEKRMDGRLYIWRVPRTVWPKNVRRMRMPKPILAKLHWM